MCTIAELPASLRQALTIYSERARSYTRYRAYEANGGISGYTRAGRGRRALPDALEPGFHCVSTHWIRGFMAFQLAR